MLVFTYLIVIYVPIVNLPRLLASYQLRSTYPTLPIHLYIPYQPTHNQPQLPILPIYNLPSYMLMGGSTFNPCLEGRHT